MTRLKLLLFIVIFGITASTSAFASGRTQTVCVDYWIDDVCSHLHSGQKRPRPPSATCIHFPYERRTHGQTHIAIHVLDFVFQKPPAHIPQGEKSRLIQAQVAQAYYSYSKIAGPEDDFCLPLHKLRHPETGAMPLSVVICDDTGSGYIRGAALHYTIENRRTPGNARIPLYETGDMSPVAHPQPRVAPAPWYVPPVGEPIPLWHPM